MAMYRSTATLHAHVKMPFHMVWLATNACTARCQHCSSNSTVRANDELSTAEVITLLDQLIEAGVFDLGISGGEPLMRTDIFDIIRYAKDQGFTVGLGSNGAKLSRHRANQLARLKLDRFQVSLDGFDTQHDVLRCWPGLYKRALSTIAIARESGLRVHVCCTINRLNFSDLGPFADFLASIGVKRLNLSRFVPTGRGSDTLDLKPEEWHSVLFMTSELKQRFRGQMEITSHLSQQAIAEPELCSSHGFLGCQAGLGQGCVTANGTVYPCVLLPLSIGNIREKPFKQLWTESDVIHTLQARENLKGKCSTCSIKSHCGGCRAVAYAITGNYLEGDPRCLLSNGAGH